MARLLILSVLLIVFCSPVISSAQDGSQPITPENVDQLTTLAQFGRGQVGWAGWTPDNAHFVLAGVQGLWFYDAHNLDAEPRHAIPFPGWVVRFAFSPDGQLIAMLDWDRSLYVGEFDPDTQEITNVALLEESVKEFYFSADSERLVTSTGAQFTSWWLDGNQRGEPTLFTFDTEQDDPFSQLLGIQAFALSPDNSTASILIGTTVRLLDLNSLVVSILFDSQTDPEMEDYFAPETAAFSPTGDTLAITWVEGAITLVDVESGTIRQTIQTHGNLEQVVFSPDGRMIACGWTSVVIGGGSAVKVWDSSTGEPIATLENALGQGSVTFSPDSTQIASVGNLIPHVWDIATQTEIPLPDIHSGPFWSVAVHPDSEQIAVSSRDGIVRIFNIEDLSILQRFDGQTGQVADVAYNADGTRLAATSPYGVVDLWDADTGEQLTRLILEGDARSKLFFRVAFDSSGELLAGGGANITLHRLITQEVDVLWQTTFPEVLFEVGFSSDGTLLAAGSTNMMNVAEDNEVKVWDVESREQTASFTHPGAVSGLVFHPTRLLMATSYTNTVPANITGYQEDVFANAQTIIRLWDGESEQIFAQLDGAVSNLVFSPDGRLLAGINGPRLHIWDVESGNELAVREIASPIIFTDLAFLPNGAMLITTANDGTIRLWGVP